MRLLRRLQILPHRGDDYEGRHAWGEWSQPYKALRHDPPGFMWWQERRCQCGNRDFRRAPEHS